MRYMIIDLPAEVGGLSMRDVDSLEDAKLVINNKNAPKSLKQKARDFVVDWAIRTLNRNAKRAANAAIKLAGMEKAKQALASDGKGKAAVEVVKSLLLEWTPFMIAASLLENIGIPFIVTKLLSSTAWITFMVALDKKVKKKEKQ